MKFAEAVKMFNRLNNNTQTVFGVVSRLFGESSTLVWKENIYDELDWPQDVIDICLDECVQACLVHYDGNEMYYISYSLEELESEEVHFKLSFCLDSDGELCVVGGENTPSDYVYKPGTKVKVTLV